MAVESQNLSDKSSPQAVETAPASNEALPSQTAKSPSFYVSLVGLGLVALITAWDATSLSIALPAIASGLGGTTLESFWASIAFILGVAITQPLYVSLSDVLGRKQSLYASSVLFIAGAIVFACARSMATLIAGRLVQGLGGGGLYVLQDIILADMTSLKERPLYLGLLAIAMAIGTILGPIIGALFSENVDWRWIGWINLPFMGIGCFIFVFFLHLRAVSSTWSVKMRSVDWIGMILFLVGATAVALPLSWAGALYPWSSWRTILPLAIGLVILVLFVLFEQRIPQEPVLPFRILSSITAKTSLLTGFVHGAIMYTMLLYVPLYFQAIFLESPLEAAKPTLPICCLTVAFSFIAPVVIEITRRYRLLLWSGWVITTLSLGLWCLVDQNSSRAMAYAFQCLIGVGIGTIFTGAQVPMQASVAHVDHTGLAVGTLIVVRLFGALIGLSVSSTLFNSVFEKAIVAIGPLPEAVKVLADPSQGVNLIHSLANITEEIPEEFLYQLIDAYRQPFLAIWIFLTSLSGLGLIASLFIKELTLEKEDIGRQGFEAPS